MSGGEGRSARVALGTVATLGLATAGAYLAERRVVNSWSAIDDPFRGEPSSLSGVERFIETESGARLRVVECGASVDGRAVESTSAGALVILAHGFTSTADHWAPLVSRLAAAGLRVVAFDQRGHGASVPGRGRFRPEDLGHDLAAVVAATARCSERSSPEGVVLVGHSMGGIGIQALLAHHPEVTSEIGALVLVATLARPVTVPLGQLMSRLGGLAIARKAMAHRVHGRALVRGGAGRVPYPTVLDVVRGGWVGCPDATRAAVMRDLRGFDFTDVLASVPVPTSVVCGDLDKVTPLRENRRIAETMPNARLEVMEGSGHAVTWEAVDRLAAIIVHHAKSDHIGDQS